MSTLQPGSTPVRRTRRPTSQRSGRTTAEDWERDWRDGVEDKLDDHDNKLFQTAIILDRLTNEVAAMKTEQRRQPEQQRARASRAQQWIYIGVASAGVVMAIISFASQHLAFR